MSNAARFGPAVAGEFLEAADALERLADEMIVYATSRRGEPFWSRDSEAGRDISSSALGDGDWADPVREAVMSIPPLLSMTHEHLRAVAVLIRAEDVILPIISACRPPLEISATAFWLAEPGVGARERARRYLNLRLQSCVEQLNLTGGLPGASDEIARRILAIKAGAERHGFHYRTEKPRRGSSTKPVRWLDPRLPRDQRLISDLMGDVGAGGHDYFGTFIHRFSSAVAHGQMHGLTPFLANTRMGDDGLGAAQMQMSLDTLASLTGGPLLGAHRLMLRLAGFLGRPCDGYHSASTDALFLWRKWITPTSAP